MINFTLGNMVRFLSNCQLEYMTRRTVRSSLSRKRTRKPRTGVRVSRRG